VRQPAPPETAATDENPYVGLTHFTEESADRFFGRDTEIALIIGNLRAARLTLLYAESGVGKSSVLRAGVVARLHANAERDLQARGSPRLVPIVYSSWSEAPVAGLIRALGDAVHPYLAEGAELDLPDDDLERAIEIASDAIDATLLIILDQFEEYFLYPEDQAEPKQVAAQVAACVNRPDLRANFLISIREDSYARLGDLFRGRIRNVYGNFLHLDFLDRAGARESIEKPIEGAFEVEPTLVDAVLDQVGRTPASSENGVEASAGGEVETTYLQLVMRRLWEVENESGSHDLRLRTLEDLGGAQAIISGHLDRAMEDGADGAGGLTDAQRRVAASIFQFLVTSGGTKIALTAKDLADYAKLPVSEVEPVLRHLSSPKLHILRPVASEDGGAPRFEIFHDALARPIVDWRTKVEEGERDAQVDRERAEKEEAQRAAAAAERREAQERKRKRLALALLGVAVVALIGGAVYFAYDQSKLADQRDAATQSVRASQRILDLSLAPSLGPAGAGLASVEAYELGPTREARNQALAQLQVNPGLPTIAAGHTRGATNVVFWPGSTKLASAGYDGTIRLWSEQGQELAHPLVDRINEIGGLAVSRPLLGGVRIVAAALSQGTVKLWQIDESGHVLNRRPKLISVRHPTELWGLAFSPRVPGMLATGGSDGRLTLFDLTNPSNPRRLGTERGPGEVSDLAFTHNGRKLVVAGTAGGQVWRVSGSGFADSKPVTLERAESGSVATAPNGSIAFGGYERIVVLDAARKRRLRLRVPGYVNSLAFAHRGSVLVSGGEDWNVTTWDLKSGRPFGPPRTAEAVSVADVATSSDGQTIASADDDGLVKLWALDPDNVLATTVGGLSPGELGGGLPEFRSIAAGAGGLVAGAAGYAGTSVWRLHDLGRSDSVPQPLFQIPGSNDAVAYQGDLLAVGKGRSFVLEGTGASCESMPAAPCRLATPARPESDGEVRELAMQRYGDSLLLASSGEEQGEGVINFWDASKAEKGGKITYLSTRRVGSEVLQIALSPASPLAAVGTQGGEVRVWDVSSPRLPLPVAERGEGREDQSVAAVAFSPDGSLLASGGQDQQVTLWEVTGEGSSTTVVATPSTMYQTQTIFSLAFSPDGTAVAAGDGEGSTCLYEVASRTSIGGFSCLPGHSTELLSYGGIEALAFARTPGGGTSLLTAGTGQPIVAWSPLLWNLSEDDRVEQKIAADVCDLAGRNLRREEWSAIFDSTSLAGDRDKTCPQYRLPR
jgi:WD40 repeat protein